MMMRDRMEGQFDLEILRALIHALGPRDEATPGGTRFRGRPRWDTIGGWLKLAAWYSRKARRRPS